ncbi:SMP-30/gluconolactonase/LRE family protein [Robiginitalea sp. M366]|uniref:SMP-30/gluconolactonase/LRE family protein n=1 Tax=Robiginitalea aestuariiviva TaxID=3036903 RepID=UPI00240E74ED|nr:SMP-30/gluconolactonase/LRE family protein [Robiginitalea aestuariiviva]MDG1571529.1 SMP-30/gluconolactonase/LRE family protein [Robiginitalea aestuariiviva]
MPVFPDSPKALLLMLGLSLMAACSTPGPDSTDLLEEGAFTPGIEGPATGPDGYIYAVNYAEEGTIGRVSPSGEASLYLRLPEGSIGNGIQFNAAGDMYIADYMGHKVYRKPAGADTLQVFAENPEMNQPNDLCVHPSGNLYLSDPKWADSTGNLWRVTPDGRTERLRSGLGTTNGITLSPDASTLYVNESVQRSVWRYPVLADGSLGHRELLIQFPDFGLDGMRCDVQGNVYIARYDKGTVAVVSPAGQMLREYRLKGKKPSNLTFGGPDGRTCYVTLADRGCFEWFEAPYPGALYPIGSE